MKSILRTSFVLFMLTLSHGCGSLSSADDGAHSDLELLICSLTNCPVQMIRCLFDPACRATLACNAACGSGGAQSEQQACHLACQLSQGAQSDVYNSLVQCFADHGCLPTLPAGTDGRCVVTSENSHQVQVLESLAEIAGTWLEIRGLNCGVPGSHWEGGYDALPCRASSWVYCAQQWWYHTSFCAPGGNSRCDGTRAVYLIAEPRLSNEEPGLLEVSYINSALQPQHERWYVLCRPDPDWIMYAYCGSTPAGEYAGVNIMTRVPNPSNAALPAEVDAAFRQAAMEYDFSYDDMCITDQSHCPPVTADEDVRNWVIDCAEQ